MDDNNRFLSSYKKKTGGENGAQGSDREWTDILEYLAKHFSPIAVNKATATELAATLDVPAAVDLLRTHAPELKVRVVNVVDLMKLQSETEHPHGLNDRDFDSIFTTSQPVIFAFHGYPWLIHRLTYHRKNHNNIHVRGYKEEGSTTTPFDMTVRNDLDRFHLVLDVIDRVPQLGYKAAYVKQHLLHKLIEHKHYVTTYGDDMPEIHDWKWPY